MYGIFLFCSMCIYVRKRNALLFIVKSLSQTEKRYSCLNLTQCFVGLGFIYVVCDFLWCWKVHLLVLIDF